MTDTIQAQQDEQRRILGFLSLAETLALAQRGNHILDVHSTLISKRARIGTGNIFYPGVVLWAGEGAAIKIGNENLFGSGTSLQTVEKGRIDIGSRCRFDGGVHIYGDSSFGDGSQVQGAIQAYGCTLAGGEDFTCPDASRRGAVLKGAGRAKDLRIRTGHVINGAGDFRQDAEESQLKYHPRPE